MCHNGILDQVENLLHVSAVDGGDRSLLFVVTHQGNPGDSVVDMKASGSNALPCAKNDCSHTENGEEDGGY